MKQVLTIVCKLQPTKEQASQIEDTLAGFANACNHINNTIDPKLTNAVRIQTLIYHAVRELFGLSANLAIRAIARVSANRKTAKQKKSLVKDFKPTSIDYDAKDEKTVEFFKVVQNKLLWAISEQTAADLVYRRVDGSLP